MALVQLEPGEECYVCGQRKRAKKGQGAFYSAKAKKLNKRSIEILAWWFSNELLRRKDLTKNDIANGFKFVGRQALDARISEMLRWDLVIWIDQARGSYKLNIPLVIKVLNAAGSLHVLREAAVA